MSYCLKIAFLVFTIFYSQISFSFLLSEDIQTIYVQIIEDIQLKKTARSLSDYKTSSKLHSLFAQNHADNLCLSLSLLNTQDIALLEEELIEHSEQYYCFESALNRISEFHENEKVKFKSLYPVNESETNLEIYLNESPLETQEIEISPQNQKQLVYDFGKKKSHWINLSFDDGPHITRSERLLAILGKEKIKANYFHIGNNTKRMPLISKRIAEMGHWVGSHSMTHGLSMPQVLLKQGQAGINTEIFQAHTTVQSSLPDDMKNPFFRFPYGAFNQSLITQLNKKNMIGFQWNMDTRDWAIPDPVKLYENILKELHRDQGGLMLFHEIHEQTLTVLPKLIEELKRKSYKTFVFKPKTNHLP